MRGLSQSLTEEQLTAGITPAHAGTIARSGKRRRLNKDHPRACGDYFEVFSRIEDYRGSPPRMRGLLTQLDLATMVDGITPAHAGTIPLLIFPSQGLRDHPRACGDYPCTLDFLPSKAGSPPRMRGL